MCFVRSELTKVLARTFANVPAAKIHTGSGAEQTSAPSEKSHRAEAAGAEAYREVTSAQEIARELTGAGFFSIERVLVDDAVLKAEGFAPFASFRTNRTKFKCVVRYAFYAVTLYICVTRYSLCVVGRSQSRVA